MHLHRLRVLRSRPRRAAPRISVVVPTYEEQAAIGATLAALCELGEASENLSGGLRGGLPDEVLVVDGGSGDGTIAAAEQHAPAFAARDCVLRVLRAPAGRARQMNAGGRAASGDLLLFLHVDTRLPDGAFTLLRRAYAAGCDGGWFALGLDDGHPLAGVIAHTATWRARLCRVATGDMGLFVSRALFDALGGYPDQPLMEDVAFSARMARRARVVALPQRVSTSARRWRERGWVRTMLLMYALRAAYAMGVDARTLAGWYPPVR